MSIHLPLRALALAVALTLATAASAAAATTINVRVEGAANTLFDGAVETTHGSLTSTVGSGIGTHSCNSSGKSTPIATPTRALFLASQSAAGRSLSPLSLQWYESFTDFLVISIGGQRPSGKKYWELSVNWKVAESGGCGISLKPNDEVLWAISDGATPPLRLTAARSARKGQALRVRVTNGASGAAVAGATVAGVSSNSAGYATVVMSTGDQQILRATKKAATRSNTVKVALR